ncbi:MAG: hypothetical protein IIW69_08095 [Bacteroidaceae bacterium]|nr:hypothetical protein [Bacteroidaceae bacterium]
MKAEFKVVKGHIEAFDKDTGEFLFSADRYSEALEELKLWQDEQEVIPNVS